MSLLSRYVFREVLVYTGLVVALLLVLTGLYLFLTEMNELGIGRYGVIDALIVVVCRLPQQAFTILPIASLIGSLLALGNLARSSELVIMRASGVSIFRLAAWVGMAGALLTVMTWWIGNSLYPVAEHFADIYKTLAKTNQLASGNNETLRARDGNTFVTVHKQKDANDLTGLYIVRFDDKHQIQSIGHAVSATLDQSHKWQLNSYDETQFEDGQVKASHVPSATFETNISPEFLNTARANPDSLTGSALLDYAKYLETNHLNSDEFRTAYWIRVARTCSILVIVMLAIPFSLGSLRSSGMGTRIVIGISVGAVFFLLAKLLWNARSVYSLDPLVVAWGPTAILAGVTALALARAR